MVEAEEYLLAIARYIHHNPVAAGLVRFPEDYDYEWSSCRMYMEERQRPAWLDADQLLSRFPQTDQPGAVMAFMRSKIEEPVKSFYESGRGLPVLGSKNFIESIRGLLRKKPVDLKEIPEAKPYSRPDLTSCLAAVKRVYGVGEEALMRSRRGQRNEARAMAMYLCRKLIGMKHEEIAKVFGVGGYSAVSSVMKRTQVELEKGQPIAGRYDMIRSLL